MLVAQGLLLSLLVPGAPWYTSPRCIEAADLVYSARLDEARVRTKSMKASPDLDDQACALWIRATMKEMEMALVDDDERLWAEMEKDLDALEAFGRANQSAQRFKDLILEAEFRRVRVYTARGERTSAMISARKANDILAKRRRVKKASPSYFYAEALINLAITHADWHVRAALKIVGISGDGERGKKAMKILLSRPSVYHSEAMVVARSFTRQKPGLFAAPLVYSSQLHADHPANPQLAFDHALDLGQVGRCKEVPETLSKMTPRLKSFSPRMQAKIQRALSACR